MERERIAGPKCKNEKDWSRFCESEERGEEMIMLGSSRGHMLWKSAQIPDSSRLAYMVRERIARPKCENGEDWSKLCESEEGGGEIKIHLNLK